MKQTRYQKSDYYRSLARKMILSVIIVSFTPLILVGSIILYRFHVSYHEKVEAHLQEMEVEVPKFPSSEAFYKSRGFVQTGNPTPKDLSSAMFKDV